MINYYSGMRTDLCSPLVILGDRATCMITYAEIGKSSPVKVYRAVPIFEQLKSAREEDRHRRYRAYSDFRSDRFNETLYAVYTAAGDVIAGPTSLMTSLVYDYKPREGELLCRENSDGTLTVFYTVVDRKWIPHKRNGKW